MTSYQHSVSSVLQLLKRLGVMVPFGYRSAEVGRGQLFDGENIFGCFFLGFLKKTPYN